jgi:hypothetical protein
MPSSSRLFPAVLLTLTAFAPRAGADDAIVGPRLVRLLGDRAQQVFAPRRDTLGALVTLPPGADPEALGLEPFVPGFARLHAKPEDLLAYADAHPDLHIEVAPPLHPLLDKAGQYIRSSEARQSFGVDGTGVLVGVADTGLDVTLADFKDPKTGKSRVAWILDLSLPARGIYPELEKKYCIMREGVCRGAVLQGKDIDAMNPATSPGKFPVDEEGHGTHVTSIAAGNGGPGGTYVGAAPGAQILFARVTEDSSESIGTDDILSGVGFIFDRADFMKRPVAVNLSIGTDFGPHDGSLAWEKALAGFVGENQPGHALAIAAGNSGSIAYSAATSPIHQTVHVAAGTTLSVPIPTSGGNQGSADVEVWVTFTPGSSVSVGLDGPDGTWILPVPNGQVGSYKPGLFTASVVNGSTAPNSQIPSGSDGAVVVWTGEWPVGTTAITLAGEGTANLWMQSSGTSAPDGSPLGFQNGVREGTINLPATSAGLIAVGCTVNRTAWTSIDGQEIGSSGVPGLDDAGGIPSDASAPFLGGEVCWFSSAGPTVTGVPKPEISAPGAYVIGAMSTQAPPSAPGSIFFDESCPVPKHGGFADERCLQVDPGHAVAEGTSMSAPMVTGGIALMFQKNPTLTESQLVPILQAGAHYFRSGFAEFEDQGGPGELDIVGSLQVMDQMSDPAKALPRPCESAASCKSWITVSTDYLLADGSTETVAIVELRTAGGKPADLFEPSRLRAALTVDGLTVNPAPAIVRRGPGLWTYTVTPRPGFGGQSITFGATFDGAAIVVPHTIPIATDPWTASYPSQATGSGCAISRLPSSRSDQGEVWGWFGGLLVLVRRLTGPRRRR